MVKLRTNFRICDQALGWIVSYSNGRRQLPVVNGYSSDIMRLSVGIPQGSVLGPTLFSFFVNDLHAMLAGSVYLFSDEVTIYCCIKKTADEAVAKLDN